MTAEEISRRESALQQFLSTWIRPTPERVRSYRMATEDVPIAILLGALRSLVRAWQRGGAPPPAAILERTSERMGLSKEFVPAHRRQDVARKRLEHREIPNPTQTQIDLEIAQFPAVFGDRASDQMVALLVESGKLPRLNFEQLRSWSYSGSELSDIQLGLRAAPEGPRERKTAFEPLIEEDDIPF